jgi:hypothetical protein
VLHLVVVLALLAGVAPAPGGSTAAAPAESRPPRRGDRGTFTLADGTTVEGTLLTTSDHGDVIELPDGTRRFLPGHSVVAVVQAPEPSPWDGLAPGRVRVRLRSGELLDAPLLERDGGSLVVEDSPGGRRVLRAVDITAAWIPGARLPQLRTGTGVARTRGLLTPSALARDPGEVGVSAWELTGLRVEVGLITGATLGASVGLPVAFASGEGVSSSLDVRYTWSPARVFHLSAGVEGWVDRRSYLVSALAAATVADERGSLTVAIGPTPTGAFRLGRFGDRVASVHGGWRVHGAVSVLAEGWLGLGDRRDRLGALGARYERGRVAVDAAVLSGPRERLVPYLAVTVGVRP